MFLTDEFDEFMIFRVFKFPKVRYLQERWEIKPSFDAIFTE